MADVQTRGFMYKRGTNPSLDRMGHANSLGIKLKTSWTPKKSPRTSPPPRSANSGRTGLSNRLSTPTRYDRAKSPAYKSAEYIQNMVVPISTPIQEDEANVLRSLSPRSFCSSTRVKKVPLPQVAPRGSTDPPHRPVSICSERYLSTKIADIRPVTTGGFNSWKQSDQAVRLEAGLKALDRCRTLKRTSEVKGYRVDRLYYISAEPCTLHHRYEVDENQLKMLQDKLSPRPGDEYRSLLQEGHQLQPPGGHYSQVDGHYTGMDPGTESQQTRNSIDEGVIGHTFLTQNEGSLKEKASSDSAARNQSAASSQSGKMTGEKRSADGRKRARPLSAKRRQVPERMVNSTEESENKHMKNLTLEDTTDLDDIISDHEDESDSENNHYNSPVRSNDSDQNDFKEDNRLNNNTEQFIDEKNEERQLDNSITETKTQKVSISDGNHVQDLNTRSQHGKLSDNEQNESGLGENESSICAENNADNIMTHNSESSDFPPESSRTGDREGVETGRTNTSGNGGESESENLVKSDGMIPNADQMACGPDNEEMLNGGDSDVLDRNHQSENSDKDDADEGVVLDAE